MKLLILGATGGIGVELVRQSLERGHSTTAFVRAPERLAPFANRIRLVQGDVLNAAELTPVLEGHDALLSGFGPRLPLAKADHDLLERFARTLIHSMASSPMRRAVIVSTSFLFKDAIFPPAHLVGRLFFPRVVKDASAMESIITRSPIDWTLVRPPQLTDKPRTGRFKVRDGRLPAFGFTISRADVAEFMVQTAESPGTIGKTFGVSN